MALQVKWSPEAFEDAESITEYISRDSEHYARSTITKIVDFAESVGKFPQMGRMVPEVKDKRIRERLVYSYRLVYKIEHTHILIVAIIHDKRLFSSISDRFV